MLRRCVSAVALAAVALALGCTKAPSDAALAESIRAQFSSDQDLKSSNLNVAVHEGVATISGGVPDASARLEAYKVAAQTTGVKKVDDQMSIEAPQSAEVPPARPRRRLQFLLQSHRRRRRNANRNGARRRFLILMPARSRPLRRMVEDPRTLPPMRLRRM